MEALLARLADSAAPLLAGSVSLARSAAAAGIDAGAADLVRAGVAPGDVVAVPGGWNPTVLTRFLALARHRAVAALTGTGAGGEDRLRTGCASWTWDGTGIARIDGARRHDLLDTLRASGRPGLVIFSSGTAGEPKAVLHDLAALAEPHARRGGTPHRLAVLLEFDHIGGVDVLLGALASGSTLVVPAGRSPDEVAAAIAAERADVLPATPTLLNLLLLSGATERHDLGSLRVIAWGAERMPPGLPERLRAALPRAELRQRFGTSETGTLPVAEDSGGLRFVEREGYGARVVDGELWLRTPHAALGYLSGPEDAWRDGWFRTGDLVEPAGNGAWRLVGRREEIINVGGEKVAPGEVEDALAGVEGVAAVRAYGERNPLTGQSVAVEVVPSGPVAPEELRRRVRTAAAARLQAWKVPARIRIVETLTATARGKLSRRSP